MAMVGTCVVCNATEKLANCGVCNSLVCPKHRAGTGSLSDGYACSGTGSGCWMGFYVGKELREVPKSSTLQRSLIAPGTPLNWALVIGILLAALIIGFCV